MKLTLLPTTRIGRASLGCILAALVSLAVFFLLVEVGERGGDTFFSNPRLAVSYLIAAAFAIAAFATGLSAFLWHRERSVAVILSTGLGMFALIWVVAEIVFPH